MQTYDMEGRLKNKSSIKANQTTSLVNIYFDKNAEKGSRGLLQSAVFVDESGKINTESYSYNDKTQLTNKTIANDRSYRYAYTYNNFGELEDYTFPTGFTIKYNYKANGALDHCLDGNNNMIYQPIAHTARGQLLKETTDNGGITTKYLYNNLGFLTDIKTGTANNETGMQHWQTQFDEITGNLLSRSYKDMSMNTALQETFTYDNVHKNILKTWQVAGQQQYNMTYASNNGNILTKSDVTQPGTQYQYSPEKPYAIKQLTTNAQNTDFVQQSVSYNHRNKTSSINHPEQNKILSIYYCCDGQRTKTELWGENAIGSAMELKQTKYFVSDDYEEIINSDGSTKKIHYLPGGTLHMIDQANIGRRYQVLTDYQGSWYSVVGKTGGNTYTLVQRSAYDPWGKRRNPDNWSYNNLPTSYMFDRGYTSHEMLDAFGLINMNGRVYDPLIARFLSPDNYVQLPDNTQNFNRYSYCLNNPLAYTDPSGELFIIDDLIVGGVGFVFGYVSSGITHGNWGWKAVGAGGIGAGGIGAGVALLSYYTAGGFGLAAGGTLSSGSTFAGNYAISSVVNSFIPSINIPITDNFSVSMSVGLGVGSAGLGSGVNVFGNYSKGNFSASLGYGAGKGGTGNYSGYGGGFRIGDFGAGYYRTSYSGTNSQVVGGVSLSYKNVSFRLENDFLGDRHDRWRSNAFELSIGDFVLGSNLYNNDVWKGYPKENTPPTDDTGMLLNNSCNRSENKAWKYGQTYSSPLWVGFKANGQIYRFGYSHPLVQDRTQNFIHKWFSPGQTHFFNKYDYFQRGMYNYVGYNNPYSLW